MTWILVYVLAAAKYVEFPSVPSTNVLRLLKSPDYGTTHGDESATGRNGPADA